MSLARILASMRIGNQAIKDLQEVHRDVFHGKETALAKKMEAAIDALRRQFGLTGLVLPGSDT